MTNINLPNLIHSAGMEAIQVMTMLGNEYEFEWYEAAVPAAGKVYLKVTSPADKFTLVNFREVRHDQTKGFYRQYRPIAFSGGTVTLLEFENNSANPAQWYAYFKQFEISAAAMTQAAEV